MDASDRDDHLIAEPELPEPIDPSTAEAELWREMGDWLLQAAPAIAGRIRRRLSPDKH